MKCFDPKLCYRIGDKRIWRHFSFWQKRPILRGRKPDLVTNCGTCLVCRKRRSIELAARCVLHASLYTDNAFLTLTYDEKRESYHNDFEYADIQKFKKRFRQHIWRSEKKRIDLFNVHEYGKNGKKHWHLVCFNHAFSNDRRIHGYSAGRPLYTSDTLSNLWDFGFSTIGDVEEASAMYTAQYMDKDFRNGNITNGKKSHSKHSGLGGAYFNKHYRQLLSLAYIPFSGRKLPLPRYFERLAHKHYCHFHEPSAFFDTRDRKALYRPFKPGQESKDISNHFELYKQIKKDKIEELEKEFEEVIAQYIDTKDVPDFVKSGSNAEYDMKHKISIERF